MQKTVVRDLVPVFIRAVFFIRGCFLILILMTDPRVLIVVLRGLRFRLCRPPQARAFSFTLACELSDDIKPL